MQKSKKIKKNIIGLIGKAADKNAVSSILCKNGFHKLSIDDKVEEFVNKLSKDNLDKSRIVKQARLRGSKLNKNYWLNLLLDNAPNDKNNILIDDISEYEVESNFIKVCQIFSKDDIYDLKDDVYDDAIVIINNDAIDSQIKTLILSRFCQK